MDIREAYARCSDFDSQLARTGNGSWYFFDFKLSRGDSDSACLHEINLLARSMRMFTAIPKPSNAGLEVWPALYLAQIC